MHARITACLSMFLIVSALVIEPPARFVSASPAAAPASQAAVTPMITAGETFSCVLKSDGSVACWGENDNNQLMAPEPNSHFTAIDAGPSTACGLKDDGSVTCWGLDSTVPEPNTGFTQIAYGLAHACGLKGDGSIACWGNNDYEQLDVPAPNSDFIQVSAGGTFSCGLKSNHSLACWGENVYYLAAPTPNSDFVQVSSNDYYSCALKTNGSILCWGVENFGRRTVPEPNSSFVFVTTGRFHACGIKNDGSVVCWGRDEQHQLTPPAPNTGFAQVSAGKVHTCAAKADGAVTCWGYAGFAPPVNLEPPAVPDGQYGAAYLEQDFSAHGGTVAPESFTFDVLSGSLPQGLTLAPGGKLSGMPDEIGSFSFYVRAKDANGYMGARLYTMTVNKAYLMITANHVHSFYGSEPVLTYTISGLVSGDTAAVLNGEPVLTTLATALSVPGNYPISMTQGTLAADNYDLAVSSGGNVVTVDPAVLTVRAEDKTRFFGHNTPLPDFTYIISGFVNDEKEEDVLTGSPLISTTATESSPIGVYDIIIKQNTDNAKKLTAANYTFAFVNGKLTINGNALFLPFTKR